MMISKTMLAALAAVVLCAGAASAAPAPLSAYGKLPNLDHVTLSPDGKTLAYIKGSETKRVLVVQAVGAKDPITIQDISDIHDKRGQKLRGIMWGDNTHLIITNSSTTTVSGGGIDQTRGEWHTAEVLDIRTLSARPLLKPGRHSAWNVISGNITRRIVNGHPVVFFGGSGGLLREDLESGELKDMSNTSRSNASSWLLDSAGNIVAEEEFEYLTAHWKLALYHDGVPDKAILDTHAPIDIPEVVGLNEDSTALIVKMPETAAEGKTYKQVLLKDGTITSWRPDLANAGDLVVDGLTGKIVGVTHTIDKTDYDYFEPHRDALWKSIKAAFAGATDVRLASSSDDKTKAVVEVFGPQFGAGYYFIDLTAKQAHPIGSTYDGINEFYDEKWITYAAADGRKITAYVTLPKRAETKNLPLIVLPHGGPQARDYPGFDWISQSLASRGYVVLQPQFRGSDGFGREFFEAGFGEFGKKMQTDLSDGVRALAAQGLIDPKRVCIFGHSYGGYAALAGATLDTGVYRCAVSGAGLSDLMDMTKNIGIKRIGAFESRYWDRYMGTADGNFAKLNAISPIKFVSRVTIPILLIHGKDDTVVPIEQSEDMASALKSAGKPYEYVTLDHEDHWLSTGATRQKYLEAVVGFIEKHNPPQ